MPDLAQCQKTIEGNCKTEFDAEPGSFLLRLRTELEWDQAAFTRLVETMHAYVSATKYGDTLERWIAEGFWYLSHFVRDWSQNPDFTRPFPAEYYEAAYERLHDLAYWLFHDERPYEEDRGFEKI